MRGHLANRFGEFAFDSRTRHIKNVDRDFPSCWFQEIAGTTMDVKNIAPIIDDDARQSAALLQNRLDQMQLVHGFALF